MKWSSTPPTEPGWYWWRIAAKHAVPPEPKLVSKEMVRGLKKTSRGEWAGPIFPPKDGP